MPRLAGLLVCLVVWLASATPAHAVTCAGLQAALNAAVDGSVVTLDEGTTCMNMSFTLPNASITLQGGGTGAGFAGDAGVGSRILTGDDVGTTVIRNLTFVSGSAPAGQPGGAIDISGDAAPILDGLEFYSNTATALAGAVRLQTSTAGAEPVVVTNSTFGSTEGTPNTGANGGGLYVNAGSGRDVEVTNTRFAGNVATQSGGGASLFGDSVTFTSNVVTANEAVSSGGGLTFSGDMTMRDNVFSENTLDDPGDTVDQHGGAVASGSEGVVEQSGNLFFRNAIIGADGSARERAGGAQWWWGPDVRIQGDRYIGNRIEVPAAGGEAEGGALSMEGCDAPPDDVRLENVVVAGNTFSGAGAGEREGAGVYTGCALGPVGLTLSNSTITANDSGGSGNAGLFGAPVDTLTMNNSIVAGNVGGSDLGGFASGTASYSDACLPGGAPAPGTGNFCANPLLENPAIGDVQQTATSPTRDKGSNALVPSGLTIDFEGDGRIQGPAVDIGADEVAVPVTDDTPQTPATQTPTTPTQPGPPPTILPRDLLAPLITAARLDRTSFAVAGRATPLTGVASQRRRVREGATLQFRLSEAGLVTVRVDRRVGGRRVGGRCVRPTRRNRTRRACVRLQRRGTLTRTGRAGLNRIAFSGRLGRRALPRGRYQLTLTARDAAGNVSRPRTLRFRIVRRSAPR